MKRLGLIGLLALTGCGEDALAAVTHVDCHQQLLAYADPPADTVNTASGLKYIEVETGSGEPADVGAVVDVNYAGYLTNETQFDTSCDQTTPVIRFTVGAGRVIPGFELGMLGMQVGGVRRLIIPPDLGYGSSPNGPIPGNSTLIFDVQLVDIPRR